MKHDINSLTREELERIVRFLAESYKYKNKHSLFVSNDFIAKMEKYQERLNNLTKEELLRYGIEISVRIGSNARNAWSKK